MMRMALFISVLLTSQSAWAIDAYDEHTADILKQAIDGVEGKSSINQSEAYKLKMLSRDLESPCLVITTKSGNISKMLVSWGFRRMTGTDKPIPVIMLDRFVTYERGKGDSTLTNGKNVMLFPGFEFDLDLGQIVPDGFDSDLKVSADGVLSTVTTARIFPLNGSQIPLSETPTPTTKPKPQTDAILPEDFEGTWKVDGDGRWRGEWNLTVTEDGTVQGKFHSDDTQASYPIVGQIGPQPNQAKFQVTFNNTVQLVDVYLWTKDKSALAGSFTMTGRKFGVYAARVKKK